MFILEWLVFQGTEKCLQYLCNQMLMDKNKELLKQIRVKHHLRKAGGYLPPLWTNP